MQAPPKKSGIGAGGLLAAGAPYSPRTLVYTHAVSLGAGGLVAGALIENALDDNGDCIFFAALPLIELSIDSYQDGYNDGFDNGFDDGGGDF